MTDQTNKPPKRKRMRKSSTWICVRCLQTFVGDPKQRICFDCWFYRAIEWDEYCKAASTSPVCDPLRRLDG
jgi:hypothetical protein